jgi:ABC-type uncharacterized transport system involved in gliding motility auxiliary subunit
MAGMNDMDKQSTEQETSQGPAAERRNWRQIASAALAAVRTHSGILALLGVLCLAAAATWFVIGRQFDPWVRGLLIGGLALLALYVLASPGDVQHAFTGRSVRYGSNAVILSIAAIGIVVLLNYLSNRYYKRFDVTQSQRHSLSPQSIQILQGLNVDIEFIGVYPSGQDQEAFETWIETYQAQTNHIQYTWFDPVREPGEADKLGWSAYGGGMIVRRGSKSTQVYTADEQDITSAILKVSSDVAKTVYFLSGHNERSPTTYEGTGYSTIGDMLRNNNYQVKSLNLVITDTVPADAAVVVIAGPQSTLLQEEQQKLISYLLNGGKALIMVDPGPETGINAVLAPWKVHFENMVVVDTLQSLSGDPLSPVISEWQYSQITKDLTNMLLVMPVACPIVSDIDPASATGAGAIDFTALASSSARSWAESDTESPQAQYDEGSDILGPLTLVASIEAPSSAPSPEGITPPNTRIVLIGDSDLAVNDVLSQIPNGEYLVTNAINWLAEEESLIAIGPKNDTQQSIRLSMVQEGAVCFGTLILIPAVIVVVGVVVWLKRR